MCSPPKHLLGFPRSRALESAAEHREEPNHCSISTLKFQWYPTSLPKLLPRQHSIQFRKNQGHQRRYNLCEQLCSHNQNGNQGSRTSLQVLWCNSGQYAWFVGCRDDCGFLRRCQFLLRKAIGTQAEQPASKKRAKRYTREEHEENQQ